MEWSSKLSPSRVGFKKISSISIRIKGHKQLGGLQPPTGVHEERVLDEILL